MALYHEAASVLTLPVADGGSLKSRIFGKKDLKSPAAQIYALALETCKWSLVLKEVVEGSQILQHERKGPVDLITKQLSPTLSLLLVHDLLLAKHGIALPQSHGLRATVERYRARLCSEFTRSRLRRKQASLEAFRAHVESEFRSDKIYPRWIRINTLKTAVTEQLGTTFANFEPVAALDDILNGTPRAMCFDVNIPNLVAVSPGFDFTKTDAYKSGAIILQDKASCFPAHLLDLSPGDGDVIDACAAPGNKTTQLASTLHARSARPGKLFAFEKDKGRAKTLERMVTLAGARTLTKIGFGQDFLDVDPYSDAFGDVGALLLDPSCSGSGIVGRDDMPDLHLPQRPGPEKGIKVAADSKKRKRADSLAKTRPILVSDDGESSVVSSDEELRRRIEALAAFQLSLLLHAFHFPAARKISYSTCSIYAGENEHVVVRALQSKVAKERGWKILRREDQVPGLREWPVRGSVDACDGDGDLADACIRTYADDGRGVMGFFVAGFVRQVDRDGDEDGPYLRDEAGRIVRDVLGIPTVKATGKKAMHSDQMLGVKADEAATTSSIVGDDGRGHGPYLRDERGAIVRLSDGTPVPKAAGLAVKGSAGVDGSGKAPNQAVTGTDVEDSSSWSGLGD